jgi:hypothetical protein
VDGILFDSISESEYYRYLKGEELRGNVRAVETQPVFLLQEGFEKNGAKYKPITYIADFRYIDKDDNVRIVDVKTKATETEVFRLKRKLFEKKYPDLHLHVEYVDKGANDDVKSKAKSKIGKTGTKKKTRQSKKGTASYRKSK